jgi:molybdopterin-guanine dinucleotide biosynthesis protein B
MRKPFILCVVGPRRHVGKTAVITKIIREMKKRSLSVGTVKHIGDRSAFDLSPRKDTSRHLEAGSTITHAVTSSEIITIRRDLPITLESALSLFPKGLHYILVEGFKQSQYPKIVVVNSFSEDLQVKGDVIALVMGEKEIMRPGANTDPEKFDVQLLVKLIEDYFAS